MTKDAAKRRYNRLAQAKHRGSKQSYVTLYENALIVLAWEAGELSEGQAAKALGVHRLLARVHRESLISKGTKIGGELWQKARPAASYGRRRVRRRWNRQGRLAR